MTRPLSIVVVGLALALGAPPAHAYLSAAGSGTGTASVTRLSAPALGAPATSSGATALSWTDAKVNNKADTGIAYVVQRRAGAGDAWTTVASGPCQSTPAPLPSTTTSCTDTTTSSAALTYRVLARFRTWTAASGEATVQVRVLDRFVLSAPSSSVAGATVPLRITAVDAAGATVVDYTGTVTLASGDAAAALPARVTFTAADAGSHLVDSGVALRTAGRQTLTAQDAARAAVTGATAVTVTPGPAARLAFAQQPSSPTPAGTALAGQPAVALRDAYDNAVTGGAPSTVTLALTSAQGATLSCAPASNSAATANGVATFAGCAVSAPGTYTLTASAPGLTSAQSASFTIVKRPQTIAFTSTAPAAARVGGATYTVAATADSGLPVSFSLASGSTGCAIAGTTVSFTAVGTCRLQADQAGNATYAAAPAVQQSFAVGKGAQTVAFTSAAPAAARVGGPTYTAAATATSGLAPTLGSATPAVCTIAAGTGVVTFVAAGTCTLTADQAGTTNYDAAPQVQQSFAVAKGTQTIAFTSTPPNPGAVNGTYAPAATATSGLAVTLTVASASASICRINATTGVVTLLATGTCTINADQAGNANYHAAPLAQQSFVVGNGLKITSADALGGGRYTFSGTGARSVLTSGSITITVCSVSIIPCPSGNVVDTSASGSVLLSGSYSTSTPTGVLPGGGTTYYAQAAQTSIGAFSPPFAFTVP